MASWYRLGAALLIAAFTANLSSAVQAQTQSEVTVQQLQEELARRDAIIADLVGRVRSLEAARVAPGAAPPVAVESTEPAAAPPADFTVDRQAAERALERALVQEGVTLLAPGRLEFTPAFRFSRFESSFPALIDADGSSVIGSVDQRLNLAEWSAGVRIGLPFDAQFEIEIPYRIVHLQTRTLAEGAVRSSNGRSGSGFGDIEVGLAKAIASQDGWLPTLIGRVTWITGTGKEFDDGLFLGGGTSALTGQLNASWRSDPVVFFVSGSYTHFFSNDVLERDDGAALSLGASLAVSPETALLFSLDQSYTSAIEPNGLTLRGTNRLSSLLNISASTILGRRTLLRVNAGIGLTGDSPDYQVNLALPMRW